MKNRNSKSGFKNRSLFLAMDALIVILAVSGLYLILKPIYIHWQQDNLTKKLAEAYEQGDGTITIDPTAYIVPGEEDEYLDEVETITPITSSSAPDTSSETTPAVETTAGPTPTPTPPKVVITAIGRIKIPVINLNMPIAEGATKYNLRVAIGHFTNGAGLGQPGNSTFFGHRMYTFGRHFNRLGEMKIGDQIIIEDKQNRYTYEVDRIDTILPDQLLSELYATAEGSRIMLVTCTPVRVASHRLLVKGKLIQTEPLG